MINLKYLKTTTDNDTEIIKTLLNIFTNQANELKADILTAFEQKNWNALREAVHKAKNSFQILGMQNEANELQELEIMCSKEKDTHLYNKYIERFNHACDIAVNEINEGLII